MPVVCRDILNLPTLGDLKLLGGEKGLNRVITWPYVCQSASISGCVHGGELIFLTGVGIKTDIQSLKDIISECDVNNLAGVVFMVGSEYIGKIDESLAGYADSIGFPLFQIPWDCMLVEITKTIANYIIRRQNEYDLLQSLMEKVIFGTVEDEHRLIERIRLFGYDLSMEHQIAVMRIESGKAAKHHEWGNDTYIQLYVRSLVNQYNGGIMSMSRGDCVILFVPIRHKNEERKTGGFLDGICCELERHFPNVSVSVGIGEPYSSVLDLKRSYFEAEKAIRVADKTKSDSNITRYLDLGIYRLFFEALDRGEIEIYCNENIGKLIEYDRLNNAELVKTLEAYFENRFNLSQTAKALFIHRNSLMYRLGRIEEILGRQLDDPYALLDVVNSVLIRKLVLSK